MNPRTPILYGLPKIHKLNSPIRPVVSFINSPCYNLSAWLNSVLREVTNFNSEYSTKNSIKLTNFLKTVKIQPSSKLISLDVKNLFPSIPPDDCLNLVRGLLLKTSLPRLIIDDLLNLLRVVLDQNFFLFNNKIFKQVSGLAMGSCLSPFLSEVFMHNLEEKIVKGTFGKFLGVYRRYVDDIFIVWNGSDKEMADFLLFVNSLHPNISFTIEEERDKQLPFLDILVTRNNTDLCFEIYRKPTTTDNVIQYSSNSPYSHKFAAFNSLLYRLFNIPLSQESFEKELNIIRHIAINNGFPLGRINQLYFKFLNKYKLTYNLIHKESTKQIFRGMTFFGTISLGTFS